MHHPQSPRVRTRGATAFRGMLGFGKSSRIHSAKILRLSEDLPVIIEIVDTQEKLETFLAEIDSIISGGIVTLEKAQIRFYRTQETS